MLCEKMADKLDMVAYDKSFADRVAELALADSLTKSAKPGWIRRGLAHVGVASITSEEEAQALRKKKNRSSSESAALNAWDTFSKRDDAKDFGFPDKKAASTYRPMFNIAKKVVDPLLREERAALGARIFRDSANPNWWTSFKNTVLPAYGQLRETHAIHDAYNKAKPALEQTMQNSSSLMGRSEARRRLELLTEQFNKDKEQAFTAIGATAHPRIQTAKMVLPTAIAGTAAGLGGMYMGDAENQSRLQETLENKPLMERLKFLISPRRSVQNYFMSPGGAQEKSSSTIGAPLIDVESKILAEKAPSILERSRYGFEKFKDQVSKGLKTPGKRRSATNAGLIAALIGGGIGDYTGMTVRGLNPSTEDQFKGRSLQERLFRGAARGTFTGIGAGTGFGTGAYMGSKFGPRTALISALLGSAGGGVGSYMLGGIDKAKPTLLEHVLHPSVQEKSSAAKAVGFAARKLLGAVPAVGGALKDVAQTGFRGAAQLAGQTAGHIGVPLENAGRALGRRRNLMFQNLRQGWDTAAGNPVKAIVDPMTNPNLKPLTQTFDATGKALTPYPSNWRNKALGAGAGLSLLGGAGVAGRAAMDPQYRAALGRDVFSRQGLRDTANIFKSPFQEGNNALGDAASTLGLPFGSTPETQQYHRPTLFDK